MEKLYAVGHAVREIIICPACNCLEFLKATNDQSLKYPAQIDKRSDADAMRSEPDSLVKFGAIFRRQNGSVSLAFVDGDIS